MLSGYKFSVLGISILSILSLIPGYQLPGSPIQYSDIMVHVVMYLILGLTVFRESSKQYDGLTIRLKIIIVLLLIVYGGVLEILQESFIPGRYGSVSDFLANAVGVLSGLIIYRKTNN